MHRYACQVECNDWEQRPQSQLGEPVRGLVRVTGERRLYRIHTGSSIRQGSTVNVVASGYVVHLKMKPTMRAIIGVWVSPYSTPRWRNHTRSRAVTVLTATN